jgi:hypothetical protein
LIFSNELNSPQNSTGKTGTQICDARWSRSRGGLARLDLVHLLVLTSRYMILDTKFRSLG